MSFEITLRSLKIASLFSLAFAILFALVSAIFYFGDWYRLMAVSCIGAFVGLVAAPEFEPKAFSRPRLVQSLSGLCAGVLAGSVAGFSIELVLAVSIAGLVVGWLAPIWVKHIQIP